MAGPIYSDPPPRISNIEAETWLLGGLMIDNRIIDRVADFLAIDDFADPFLGRVYAAICRQHDLGKAANPVTILPYFDEDPSLADLGGRGWFAGLTGSGLANLGAIDNARQVAELGSPAPVF